MQGRLIGLVTMIPRCSGQMSSLFRRQLVVTGTNHIRLGAPTMMMTLRSFSTTNNNKKKKKQQPARKLSSKQRRKRESEKAKRRNEWLAREKKLKRQKNLHPAAKMKRILSATDYWFSHVNGIHTSGAIIDLSEIQALGRSTSLVSSLYQSGSQKEVQSHY